MAIFTKDIGIAIKMQYRRSLHEVNDQFTMNSYIKQAIKQLLKVKPNFHERLHNPKCKKQTLPGPYQKNT